MADVSKRMPWGEDDAPSPLEGVRGLQLGTTNAITKPFQVERVLAKGRRAPA